MVTRLGRVRAAYATAGRDLVPRLKQRPGSVQCRAWFLLLLPRIGFHHNEMLSTLAMLMELGQDIPAICQSTAWEEREMGLTGSRAQVLPRPCAHLLSFSSLYIDLSHK